MSTLAVIRPDEWNLPLYLHVLSALVLIGAVALVLIWLAAAWRVGSAPNTRLAFRTLLWAAIPAWIVMRLTAQWLLDEQGLEDADLAWIDIGFTAAEPTFLLLVIATVITGLGARAASAGASGPSIGGRIATGLVSVCLLAYLVALWAMTTKPV